MEKNDSYLGNPSVKRDGVVTNWTNNEVKEYAKCMQDPAYFARTYCKVIHLDKGLVPFDLYPYQEKMFNHFNTNRFNIVLACRQSGKSISSVAYLLWFALFNSEKVIAVMANKGATAREMLGRVTLMLENLPFFYNLDVKLLIKGLLNLVIIQGLLLLQHQDHLFAACQLIFFILTSLHLLKELQSFILQLIQLYHLVEILRL